MKEKEREGVKRKRGKERNEKWGDIKTEKTK